MAIELERLEGDLAEGKPVDLDLLNRLVGGLGRVYERIGLKRVAREALDLKAYIAAHAERETAT